MSGLAEKVRKTHCHKLTAASTKHRQILVTCLSVFCVERPSKSIKTRTLTAKVRYSIPAELLGGQGIQFFLLDLIY